MIKLIVKLLKIVGLIIVILSILFLAKCTYSEVSQRNNLLRLCENIKSGDEVTDIINKANKEGFEIRSETLKSMKARDWFNRQYDRFLETFRENENAKDYLTVIFAKPGIGYYACIIEHDDVLVKHARYLDRSS